MWTIWLRTWIWEYQALEDYFEMTGSIASEDPLNDTNNETMKQVHASASDERCESDRLA